MFEILRSRELVGGVAEHGCGAAGVTIGVDEGFAFDVVVTLPVDRKGSVGFLDVERFGVTLAGEPERQVIVAVDDPGVAGFGGEQRELTEGDDAPIVLGGAALDVAARRTLAPSTMRWPGPRLLDRFLLGHCGACQWTCSPNCSAISWSLSYHCFDRIVIHGKPSPCERQ